ncbi:helix-turn-helix domain-containing protein [Candidatus Acetothermia bacterium]|jgi:putative transcriptional regulator|nr:helix-turn-helix domain-containing protein [Candidatus Acetothermia bacterium]MCI2431091.1 helix-turn-helix domain-containing protein [Candidatus Acetothermia bacterium]MCI2435715.1 helix-turn-helix domain-containing protein [Candidatus Acetothermia bacterium]
MRKEMFQDLVASVCEGSAILRGKATPSRSFVVKVPDVKRIRASYQLAQIEFAALLGISVKTLRNWEQGRRVPEGPARVLLQIAAKHPEAIWDVVRPTARSKRNKPKRKDNVA